MTGSRHSALLGPSIDQCEINVDKISQMQQSMLIDTPNVIVATGECSVDDFMLKVGTYSSVNCGIGKLEFKTSGSNNQQTPIQFTRRNVVEVERPTLIEVELMPVTGFDILDHNQANYIEINYDSIAHFKMLMSKIY